VVDGATLAWFDRNAREQNGQFERHAEQTDQLAMNAQELLQEISDYCRQTGLAESPSAAAP